MAAEKMDPSTFQQFIDALLKVAADIGQTAVDIHKIVYEFFKTMFSGG